MTTSETGGSFSQTRAAPAAPAVLRPHLPLGVVVAMACLAQFMVVLDSSIVILALPDMRAGLGLSASQQQWVVSGYLLTLGGVLTAELSWRWVLFVNIPLGAGLLAAALLSLVPAPASAERTRLDLPGALSITLGIGALTYGLSHKLRSTGGDRRRS